MHKRQNHQTHTVLTIPLILILALTSGCASIADALSLQKPTATLQDVAFQDINLQSATLLFDVNVENPYSLDLPLLNLDYDLSRQGQSFLTGLADLQTTIPAQSTKAVTLPITLTYRDLYQAFKDVRPGSIIPYQADMGLSVDAPLVGKLRVPFTKEGELAVPNIPNPSEIDWKNLIDKLPQKN